MVGNLKGFLRGPFLIIVVGYSTTIELLMWKSYEKLLLMK